LFFSVILLGFHRVENYKKIIITKDSNAYNGPHWFLDAREK